MTNELGTTLQDIQAKAERKREALDAIGVFILYKTLNEYAQEELQAQYDDALETIRKYIEEN